MSVIRQASSFINFGRSLANLKRSVATPVTEPRDLSGILKDFEMSYELSWKVLKRLLQEEGHQTLGAKDVYTKAYQLGYLSDDSVWLRMIEDRNRTAHVYDEAQAKGIAENIRKDYLPALEALLSRLSVS